MLQVDEVKNIMVDNIERVLERGEKIELLVDKTDNLRFQVNMSQSFSALPRMSPITAHHQRHGLLHIGQESVHSCLDLVSVGSLRCFVCTFIVRQEREDQTVYMQSVLA